MHSLSKKVSMQQIADRLGLSKYTVSQALSGKSGVSEENRLRIQEMAKAMGYLIQSAAQTPGSLNNEPMSANGQTPYILVWIQAIYQQDNPFWGKVLAGIGAASKDLGFEHLIIPVPAHHNEQLQIPSYVNPDHCAGHLLAGTFPTLSVISLQQTGIPLVLIDHSEPLVDVDCVLNNNLDSGKMACQRLLATGLKRLVFVGDDQFAISFKERFWGCRMAMEDLSKPDEDYSLKKWSIPYQSRQVLQYLERKVSALSPESLPEGMICANDQIALELIPLLKRHGIDVPGQVKVIGIDNIDASAYAHPPLSTIELAKESLGIRAVETLLYRLKHPGRQAEKIILSSRFIARDSG
ncbi:LacI family DNA-binding transcriptional regulator [Paenibacillus chondroitinus]|uniref:LacI family DNA-binding transcriptional regulator n=1 Tax=Paenibacillus chondroitinus TaxID=59842 RepID=A0ABU6D729_9BACL|nr:LacI family DNA-binding transcriptional regulator [Paenibacillus chondroitinus]MEB4793544.1 LacI family DNA-binding transcriptional regulator [Paenibacillus chondroitinus]